MLSRYLAAATVGIAVTTVLVWVMQYLIATTDMGDPVRPIGSTLDIGRKIIEKPVEPQRLKPEPIKDPVRPPDVLLAKQTPSSTPVGVPTSTPPPVAPINHNHVFGRTDGSLINVVNSRPDYPLSLSTKGIEGQAIVQFDVTVSGAVENVVVLETTHTAFGKAAAKAAYRSRYKPPMIDGTPQRTEGLKKLFTFELEK